MATEVVRRFLVDAVELLGGVGLGIDVERLWCVGLETPGEFVAVDHGLDGFLLTGHGGALELLIVETAQQIELARLRGR